jgi:hypothetical protein
MARNEIEILLMNPEWTIRAHPLLMMFKGGHRVKAGEYFLEIDRTVVGIYQSFKMIETFLNRGDKDLYVDLGNEKAKVIVSDAERIWMMGYLVENAYLRIGSALDKIAQMVRVFYEHPDHGGQISIRPRCGKCPSEIMTEKNCSFGALVTSLRENGRINEVDQSLFRLQKSEILSNVKTVRNDITHKINKTIFYPGLDPNVKVEVDGDIQKTTMSLGQRYQTPEEYREILADAYNEIIAELNVLGPIVFPEGKSS